MAENTKGQGQIVSGKTAHSKADMVVGGLGKSGSTCGSCNGKKGYTKSNKK